MRREDMKYVKEFDALGKALRPLQAKYARDAVKVMRKHFDIDSDFTQRGVALQLASNLDLSLCLAILETEPKKRPAKKVKK